MTLPSLPIKVSEEALRGLCQKWKVKSLAVFGSVLSPDFNSASDVDLLVLFEDGASPSLFELVALRDEFQELFQRSVDVVSRKAIERSSNQYRKDEILGTSQIIYEKEAA